MKEIYKIFKYSIADITRSRWLLAYLLFYLAFGLILFYLDKDFGKVLISISNIIIYITPLVSIVYTTIYYYNSQHFIELLLTMPIQRKSIIYGIYFGISMALSLGLIVGINIPILLNLQYVDSISSLILLNMSGIALTFIFTGISLLIVLKNENRIIGFGLGIVLWLFASVLYDALILSMIIMLKDYPLDNMILITTIINPVDLARVSVILNFESAAVLGYTGLVFRNYFSTSLGLIISIALMFIWTASPILFTKRIFTKKDF